MHAARGGLGHECQFFDRASYGQAHILDGPVRIVVGRVHVRERAQGVDDGRAGPPLARGIWVRVLERTDVRGPEREHRTNLLSCRTWSEQGRQVDARVQHGPQRGLGSVNPPCRGQFLQAIEIPEVAGITQRPVERAHRLPRHLAAGVHRRRAPKRKMRRPQQRHQRASGEVRRRGFEQEVESRCDGLGRKRQRVGGLKRDAGGTKHFRRQIQIRQRRLVDNGGACERNGIAAAAIGLEHPCDRHQLFFAIAERPPGFVGWSVRRGHQRGCDGRSNRLRPNSFNLVEPRPPGVQAFVKARTKHRVGAHDVERREPGKARQEVEVRGVKPLCFGNPVGHRDDDVPDRIRGRFPHEMLAQHVLVASARLPQTPFVFAKRVGQKPRLPPHPNSRAVVLVRTERVAQEFFEPLHVLRLAAEMIVEPEDLRDQPGSKLKRQFSASRCRRARGRLRQDVALDRAEAPGWIRQPRVQQVVQLVARDEEGAVNPLAQLMSRAPGGNDDDGRGFGVPGSGFRVRGSGFGVRAERRDRVTEGLETRDADEPGPARRYHRSCGGRSSA